MEGVGVQYQVNILVLHLRYNQIPNSPRRALAMIYSARRTSFSIRLYKRDWTRLEMLVESVLVLSDGLARCGSHWLVCQAGGSSYTKKSQANKSQYRYHFSVLSEPNRLVSTTIFTGVEAKRIHPNEDIPQQVGFITKA